MTRASTDAPERNDSDKIRAITQYFIEKFGNNDLEIKVNRTLPTTSSSIHTTKEPAESRATTAFVEPTEEEITKLNIRIMNITSTSEKRGFTKGSKQESKMINEVLRLICEYSNWDFSKFNVKKNNPESPDAVKIECDIEVSYTYNGALTDEMRHWLGTKIYMFFGQENLFNNGDNVTIHRLIKQDKYNDLSGIIQSYNDTTKRYAVKLDSTGKTISVRATNLIQCPNSASPRP